MTDEELLALYERTLDDVYRYASRLCGGDTVRTEDLVQDTYLSLVRFVQAHPEESVGVGWLVTTCRNRFVDVVRGDSRRRMREMLVARRTAEESDADECLPEVMAKLSDQQRAALTLRYFDDLPVPEVARILGRSVHATESLLARGRAALRRPAYNEVRDERQ